MRQTFPGYYTPTAEEFGTLWKAAHIAFDANVPSNLYGYSEPTRKELFDMLGQLRDRIWLPYQSAKEYHHNHAEVVCQHVRKYSDVKETISKATVSLTERKQHPFIADELLQQFLGVVEQVERALDDGGEKLRAFRTADPVRKSIDELFEGRVGDEIPGDELDGIFKEGSRRGIPMRSHLGTPMARNPNLTDTATWSFGRSLFGTHGPKSAQSYLSLTTPSKIGGCTTGAASLVLGQNYFMSLQVRRINGAIFIALNLSWSWRNSTLRRSLNKLFKR
jgi:PIN like domain